MAKMTMAVEVLINRLESLARRWLRLSQPRVHSIAQRLRMTSKPLAFKNLEVEPAPVAWPAVTGPR